MMSPGGVWRTCGIAMLLVAMLGVCLLTAAEAAPAPSPVCTAITGEELSASKSPVPVPLAMVVVGNVIVQEALPSAPLRPESSSPRASSDLRGDLAPRAPPVRL
jgi:ABC-type uncharacterized transport system permease subunit